MSETAESLRTRFAELGIEEVRIGSFDLRGGLRERALSLEQFWSALDRGCGTEEVGRGWGIAGPEAYPRIDPSTFRLLPGEPRRASLLVDLCGPDRKNAHPGCPRSLLKRVVARAEAAGMLPVVGEEGSSPVEVADRAALEGAPTEPVTLKDTEEKHTNSLRRQHFFRGQTVLSEDIRRLSQGSPHLALAASLGAGLYGVERAIEAEEALPEEAACEILGEAALEFTLRELTPKRAAPE